MVRGVMDSDLTLSPETVVYDVRLNPLTSTIRLGYVWQSRLYGV